MRASVFVSALVALAGTSSADPLLKERAVCNADNCARLVTGTRAGLPSTRLQDCSSFLLAVVTPAPVFVATTIDPTVTVYTTYTTVTDTIRRTVATQTPHSVQVIRTTPQNYPTYLPRDEAPLTTAASLITTTATARAIGPITETRTLIPSYASSVCAPASRYSSACHCAGVTGYTQTVVGTTSTITVYGPTKTATSSVIHTTTITRDALATAPVVVDRAYGLPCNSAYSRKNSTQSYNVKCGQFPNRVTDSVGVFKGIKEFDCVDRCSLNSQCLLATYGFQDMSCSLWATIAEPGFASNSGTDVILRQQN